MRIEQTSPGSYEAIVMEAGSEQDARVKHRSLFELAAIRFMRNRLAVIGMVILLIMVMGAIFAPIIVHETAAVHPAIDVHPEIALQAPSLAHPLGTDFVGRDQLARLLYGARVSLLVGFVSMLVAIGLGVIAGSLAGFFGGFIDNLLMRIADAFLAVPLYIILFVISAFWVAGGSGSIGKVILLLGAFSWANTARIVRGEILSLREREYVTAARAQGVSNLRIIARHILPNALGPIIVSATLLIGGNIVTESTLSFFGFGVQPPDASWGNMLADSQAYFYSDPILIYAPGLAILLTVLSFNLMGDGLRDAFDPYTSE
jgi:peptide/nickel transport system permease protein